MTFNRRLACHFLKVTPAKHSPFYNVGEIEMIFIFIFLEFKVSQIILNMHGTIYLVKLNSNTYNITFKIAHSNHQFESLMDDLVVDY